MEERLLGEGENQASEYAAAIGVEPAEAIGRRWIAKGQKQGQVYQLGQEGDAEQDQEQDRHVGPANTERYAGDGDDEHSLAKADEGRGSYDSEHDGAGSAGEAMQTPLHWRKKGVLDIGEAVAASVHLEHDQESEGEEGHRTGNAAQVRNIGGHPGEGRPEDRDEY